jgi:hypothetical protein
LDITHRNDSALFARIGEEYGEQLEQLDRQQLLALVRHIGNQRMPWHALPPPLALITQQLSPDGALALMEAAIAQLRYGASRQ